MSFAFKIALIFGYINFFIIFLECLYSFYKKDKLYSLWGTIGNVCNGLIMRFISGKFVAFHLVYFTLWYAYLGYGQKNTGPIGFIYCLLLVDFIYYLFHRMHHSFSFLWTFHAVHHGDDKLNLSTAYRISWIEQFYLSIFFTPVVLIGFNPFDVITAFYLLSIYQFLCHSSYLKFPKYFDLVLVTPYNHSIHHDREIHHQNSNFGGVFSIWDRLFNTYTAHIDTFTPGIKGYHQDNFIKMETDPIVRYFRRSPSQVKDFPSK